MQAILPPDFFRELASTRQDGRSRTEPEGMKASCLQKIALILSFYYYFCYFRFVTKLVEKKPKKIKIK